jgi:hypothetical protein
MTPTEARKFFENNPNGLEEINAKITAEILNQCGNDPLIKEIINHILSKDRDPYAFFVGNNEKDITGLLGEIKGMYYLASLIGKEAISKDMLTWEGGTHTGAGGAKPHRDIILEGLGIQVKNTASDKNYLSSSFTEASIDTFLDSAGIPVDFRNLFRNYYGVLSFNVPFHIGREGKAVADYSSAAYSQDSVSRHKSMYSKLKEANNEITKSLAIYASSLMYINADKISKKELAKTDKNVLYFVAGKHFMLAS